MVTLVEKINELGAGFVGFSWAMLVQSSVLVVVLLILDVVLRKRVRAVFRYCLWMLVLVKLVLPSSLSSPVSLGYLFPKDVTQIQVVKEPAIRPIAVETKPIDKIETGIGTIAAEPKLPIVKQETAVSKAEVKKAEAAVSLSRQGVLFLGWVVIVGAMILLLVQRVVFVFGLVRQAKEANGVMKDALGYCCEQMKMRRKIGLKVSANATSPAVCGLIRPVILVPENLGSSLGAASLRAVMMHELSHIKRGDLWVNVLQTILQIAYFYNPLVWFANWMIRRVREQAVDEMVLVAMGERAEQYPETLLNVAKMAFGRPALSLRLIGVVESKSALKSRIERMMRMPIPKSAKLGFAGLAAIIIIGVALLPMAQAEKSNKATESTEKTDYSTVTVTEGVGFDGIIVGDANCTKEFIKSKLGKPEEDKIDSFSNGWYLNYKKAYGLDFWLDKGDVLREIRLNRGFKGKLTSGISMSSSKEDVFRIYGRPIREVEAGDKDFSKVFENQVLFYRKGPFWKSDAGKIYYNKNGRDWLLFWFEGDRIQQIVVFPKEREMDTVDCFKKRLEQSINLEISQSPDGSGLTVQYGIIAVCEAVNIPYQWDKTAGLADPERRQFIKPLNLKNTPAKNVLENILQPVGLEYKLDAKGLYLCRGELQNGGNVVSAEKSQFTATLANGVMVKLYTICKFEDKIKEYWKPNGSLADDPKYAQPKGISWVKADEKNNVYQFTAKVTPEYGYMYRDVKWDVPEGSRGDNTGRALDANGKEIEDLYVYTVTQPKDKESALVHVGILSGKWQVIATHDEWKEKTYETDQRAIGFGVPYEKDGITYIPVSHTKKGREEQSLQVVALTKDGKEVRGSWSGSGSNQISMATASFRIPLANISEFQFQVRPYQWVEFKNVSLTPNVKTDVQIGTGEQVSSGAGEESQKQTTHARRPRRTNDAVMGPAPGMPVNNEINTALQDSMKIVANTKDRYEKLLQRTLSWDFRDWDSNSLTVQYEVMHLCELVGVPYQFEKSQKLAGEKIKERIKSEYIHDMPARLGILHVLEPLGLTFGVDENGLYICPIGVEEGGKKAKEETAEKEMTVYEVNREVSSFPEDDFSTPESAYAAINRVWANNGDDPNAWQRVSVKSAAELLSAEKQQGKTKVEPEWAKVLLNAKILEVRIWNGNSAMVAAELPQQFSSKPIVNPIDVRYLELENGRWLNIGNDRFDTIEQAWAKFSKMGGRTKEQRIIDEKLKAVFEHPDEIVGAAKELFDKIRQADYGYINGHYMTRTRQDLLREWMRTTFKDNPIVNVELGKVFVGDKEVMGKKGWPTIPYKLTLKDGGILEGELPFEYNFDGGKGYWNGMEGIDWHLEKDPIKKPNVRADVQVGTGEQVSSGAGKESQMMEMMAQGGGSRKTKTQQANDANMMKMMEMMMGQSVGGKTAGQVDLPKDLVWGEAVNGLRAAVELIPTKSTYREIDGNAIEPSRPRWELIPRKPDEYSIGELIKICFYIRNDSNSIITLTTAENRYDKTFCVIRDVNGNKVRIDSRASLGWPAVVRKVLLPGDIISIKGPGLGLAGDEIQTSGFNYPDLNIAVLRPGEYSVHYELMFPDIVMYDKNGQPKMVQASDWKGKLITGERKIQVVSTQSSNSLPSQVDEPKKTEAKMAVMNEGAAQIKINESYNRIKNLQCAVTYDDYQSIEVLKVRLAAWPIESNVPEVPKASEDIRKKELNQLRQKCQDKVDKKIERTFQNQKIVIGVNGRAKIELDADSDIHIDSWDGTTGVSFIQRKEHGKSAAIYTKPPPTLWEGRTPLWLFGGKFRKAMEKASAMGVPINISSVQGGKIQISFVLDKLEYVGLIDPEKEYSLLQVETYHNGALDSRFSADFKKFTDGIWFPVKGKTETFISKEKSAGSDKSSLSDSMIDTTSDIKLKNIKINSSSYSDDLLRVNLPPDTRITEITLPDSNQQPVGSNYVGARAG